MGKRRRLGRLRGRRPDAWRRRSWKTDALFRIASRMVCRTPAALLDGHAIRCIGRLRALHLCQRQVGPIRRVCAAGAAAGVPCTRESRRQGPAFHRPNGALQAVHNQRHACVLPASPCFRQVRFHPGTWPAKPPNQSIENRFRLCYTESDITRPDK